MNASPTDDELAVDRILTGDTGAFADIVTRWQGPLVNLAYRFCRDHSRAEDMAQDAFVKAFRGLSSWRRDSAFSTWLFALATNVYRDEIRRYSPMMLPVAEDDAMSEPLESDAVDIDERRAVHEAVMSLPPKYRDPLILYYFHEQDVAATADTLNLPQGTIKARLSRGRAFLGSKLNDKIG
ncbi:MAG: sigma-70 family RNA polymerase sigma factor [Pseudomonadota bacterium]